MTDKPEQPDLNEAIAAFQAGVMRISAMLKAQSAIGWMMRGDLPNTYNVLQGLPADALLELSAAAAALSSVADVLATGKDAGQ